MKKLLTVLSLLLIAGIFAATPEIKSDGTVCVDGVCYLPGMEPETAAAGAVPETAPAEQYTLIRRGIGLMGTAEFRDFLLGNNNDMPMHFWGMLLMALLGGFLLNLTPCVLPMIPINLAVIGASGGKNGFVRALVYGCGMAIAYGTLGILAAFAGISFGTVNSSPYFNSAIGILFVLMAVAMTGKINFDLSRLLPNFGGKLRTASMFWIFIAGALSALLAGACVAPAVVSVLVYTTGAVAAGKWYAVIVPFALGIGMALPWPLAGKGISIMPKPGKFMVAVKYLFALLIFAAGVYYIMLGVKLSSAPQIDHHGDGFKSLAAARRSAIRENRPILIKFTASWCKNCAAMEQTTLAEPGIKQLIRDNFIMVTFPAENPNDPEISALFKKWQIPGLPAFVIVKPAKQE